MEQNNQFIGGMPGQEVDPALLQDALNNVMKQNAQNSAPALGMFAQLQQRRADRMNLAAGTLGKELGKDHPDVVALQATAASVSELNVTVNNQSTRLKTWPKARSNEWVVFGTVSDAQDGPAAGMTVRVFDRDRKYDDLLGETESDENGDFSIVYHERDFKETNENLPELYVMVMDVNGKLLYSSRDNVRFKSGQSEYFAIKLGTSPGRTTKPKATKTDKTVKQAGASAPTAKSSDVTTKISRKKK